MLSVDGGLKFAFKHGQQLGWAHGVPLARIGEIGTASAFY
jgi:hypothetical protein